MASLDVVFERHCSFAGTLVMPWKQLFHAQSPDAVDRKLADLKCISLIPIFQSVEISRGASMRKIFIADDDALVEMISPPCYQHISKSLLGGGS